MSLNMFWKYGVYLLFGCGQILLTSSLIITTNHPYFHLIFFILAITSYMITSLTNPGYYLANPQPNIEDAQLSLQGQKVGNKSTKSINLSPNSFKEIKQKPTSVKQLKAEQKKDILSLKQQDKQNKNEMMENIVITLNGKNNENFDKQKKSNENKKEQMPQVQNKKQNLLSVARSMFGKVTQILSNNNIKSSNNIVKQQKAQQKPKQEHLQHQLTTQRKINIQQKQGKINNTCDANLELIAQVQLKPQAKKSNVSFYSQKSNHKKYCRICQVYQPIRTKHCHNCDFCIGGFDHHCPWIGNCIGEKNKLFFIIYILAQTLQFVAAIIDISISLQKAILNINGLVLFLIAIILMSLLMLSLLIFHSYLILNNLSTWQLLKWNEISYLKQIDNKKLKSPFSKGFQNNIKLFISNSFKQDLHNWQKQIIDNINDYKFSKKNIISKKLVENKTQNKN